MNPAERKKFKNTFLPNFKNKWFTVSMLVDMLRIGVRLESYPDNIRKLVEAELSWRREQEKLK